MVRYLTGVSTSASRAIAFSRDLGILCVPGNGYTSQIDAYPFWAADNGCFAQGERFDLEAYLAWLEENAPKASSCLWATAPDVVGNMAKTWARSAPVLERIRAIGFRVALVAQNGLALVSTDGAPMHDGNVELAIFEDERDPRTDTGVRIPWESFDALFIGGDDRFKLSHRTSFLIHAAKMHGKTVHMGRVNSYSRLQVAEHYSCDTADGTFLKFAGRSAAGAAAAVKRMERWFDELWSFHVAADLEAKYSAARARLTTQEA